MARKPISIVPTPGVSVPDAAPEPKQLMAAYRIMLTARMVDEKIVTLCKQNKCNFEIGCAGHEACQAAAAHVFRAKIDWFYPYYRDLALCVGLDMSLRDFFLNALNREADPHSHGRQMPMHWGSRELHMPSQSSPTGTQFLQAVGCALGTKIKGAKEVVYVSSGEGACAQGDFHEALNWASRERLPVVFLIENNAFAISVRVSDQLAGASVASLCHGYDGLRSFEIDGTDYLESYAALKTSFERALRGDGPTVIEAHVPRLQSHSISDNQLKYRTQKELDHDVTRDPIPRLSQHLIGEGIVSQVDLDAVRTALKLEIDAAAEWAEARPECIATDATLHTFVEPDPACTCEERVPEGPQVPMVEAINHALAEELDRNPEMLVFGQDVAYGKGGVFTVTTGLTARFGDTRVFNAPLAESSIAGVSIGLAHRGLKAVSEIQFADFIWTGMMQIRNEMAMMNYRSGGEWPCAMVIRVPVGGYIHGGPYHSQNVEATLAHFPGLFVVYPSNASDAKGLLKGAIRGRNPVLFLEHKGLYRQPYARGCEGGREFLVPLGKAKVVRTGADLTIVTWGALVHKSLLAATQLEREGKSVEVLDLRTIVPFDAEAVFKSVRKTHRVLVAHEDVLFMGFGAEIAAQIGSECFSSLDAAVERVGMKYVAGVPHSPVLEQAVFPQEQDVLAAARAVMLF